MDLRDYVRLLRKGWPLLLSVVVLGAALGIGLTLATSKVYQASVQVFVATSSSSDATDLSQGNTFTSDRVQSYTSIANSPKVTQAVVTDLKKSNPGLKLSSDDLASKITADAPLNKVLINLHVTNHNPQTSAVLADAVAKQFISVVQSTEQKDSNGASAVKLTVIHPATVPAAPIKPNKVLNIGLGLLLGLLVGVGFVVLRDVLDNTVKGPEDFEALGVPVLGLVPFDKRTPRTPIAFRADPHGARSEAYRQLRTNLQFINVDSNPRVIAVTSAVPGEGKTTTAINLAAALAEGGYRVCLIEADLRRPTIATALGLVSDVGFTTALIGKVAAVDVLQNAGRNLAVLTSGPVPPNPSELLITSQAQTIIREIAAAVDFTIIDTAPLLPVADGAEVAAMADATLIVHHAGKSTRDQAARSIEALAKVGERPVGVILNRLVRGRGNSDYNYGYYYSYRPDRTRRAAADKLDPATGEQGDSSSETATQSANGAEPPAVSYAVADLPPTREPVGHNGYDLEEPDFAPAIDYRTTATLEQSAVGRAASTSGEQPGDVLQEDAVRTDELDAGGYTNGYAQGPRDDTEARHEALTGDYEDTDAESLFRDDAAHARTEPSRSERWRELRERRSRR